MWNESAKHEERWFREEKWLKIIIQEYTENWKAEQSYCKGNNSNFPHGCKSCGKAYNSYEVLFSHLATTEHKENNKHNFQKLSVRNASNPWELPTVCIEDSDTSSSSSSAHSTNFNILSKFSDALQNTKITYFKKGDLACLHIPNENNKFSCFDKRVVKVIKEYDSKYFVELNDEIRSEKIKFLVEPSYLVVPQPPGLSIEETDWSIAKVVRNWNRNIKTQMTIQRNQLVIVWPYPWDGWLFSKSINSDESGWIPAVCIKHFPSY